MSLIGFMRIQRHVARSLFPTRRAGRHFAARAVWPRAATSNFRGSTRGAPPSGSRRSLRVCSARPWRRSHLRCCLARTTRSSRSEAPAPAQLPRRSPGRRVSAAGPRRGLKNLTKSHKMSRKGHETLTKKWIKGSHKKIENAPPSGSPSSVSTETSSPRYWIHKQSVSIE